MSSIRKRILCALTALAAAAALSGCSGVQNEERPESPTLAPAAVKWEAPDGDRSVLMPFTCFCSPRSTRRAERTGTWP